MSARTSSNPGSDQPPDDELVARARAGDRDAFESLVLRYQDLVYNMSLRLLHDPEDALDASQEIFWTVYRSLARFEARARFSTWLYRITVNRCRDEMRRRATVKHTRPHSLDLRRGDDEGRVFEPEAREPSPVETAEGRETEALIEAAIAKLPEETREALVLRDIQDLSYEEMAEVLEVPVGTVRSRLHRARALLKEALKPILEVEP